MQKKGCFLPSSCHQKDASAKTWLSNSHQIIKGLFLLGFRLGLTLLATNPSNKIVACLTGA
jgi:hypothetical protein